MTLTTEQQLELHDAKERAGSFLGAAKVAAFNGWSLGFFAVMSILFGLFSRTSFLVGVGLAVIARNEFVGRDRLRSFNPAGPELLWRNQVGLMAIIMAYCMWSAYSILANPNAQMAEYTELLGIEDVIQSVSVAFYALVIIATGIFQGLNARYYFLRVALMKDYLRDTPQWVLDLQRSTVVG
jgi:hypothetical protein